MNKVLKGLLIVVGGSLLVFVVICFVLSWEEVGQLTKYFYNEETEEIIEEDMTKVDRKIMKLGGGNAAWADFAPEEIEENGNLLSNHQ